MCSNIEYRDEKEIGEPVWADFPPILCLFLANWMNILYIWADLLAVLNHQSHLCWISTFVLFCIFDNALTKCMCLSKIQLTVMETTMMMILVLKTMMIMVIVAQYWKGWLYLDPSVCDPFKVKYWTKSKVWRTRIRRSLYLNGTSDS